MALRINPRLLTQSFDYYELEEMDTWSTPTYKEPVTINNVRIDTTGVLPTKAIAFVYASDSIPFPKFTKRSKIVTETGEYIINKIIEINEPFDKKVWCVELELV
jgi:hypothetical protein